MSEMIASRIKMKHGNMVNLPMPLEPGEIALVEDTKQVFIGLSEENSFPISRVLHGTNNQIYANDTLNSSIIKFTTMQVSLSETTDITNPYGSEYNAFLEISKLPASSFSTPNGRDVISRIEQYIPLLHFIRVSLPPMVVGNFPINTTYSWNLIDEPTHTYEFVYYVSIGPDSSNSTYPIADMVSTISALNDAGFQYNATQAIGSTAGIVGVNITVGANPYNYQYSNNELTLPTIGEACNLTTVVNMCNPTRTNGLVNVKSNFEILTEANAQNVPNLKLTNQLLYELPSSGTFIAVANVNPAYSDAALAFNLSDSDVQVIEYVAATEDGYYINVGTLKVLTLATTTHAVVINDSPIVNVDAATYPTEQLLFDATYSSGVVTVKYKHNFASNVVLKVKITRIKSIENV